MFSVWLAKSYSPRRARRITIFLSTVLLTFSLSSVTPSQNCMYSIEPTSVNMPAAGGATTFQLTTDVACIWGARSNVSWITINPPSSGYGDYPVNYTVQPNQGPARVGTINSSGLTFTVNQAAPAQRPVTVDGRVLTSDGRGLRNATVSITDSNGVSRISTTSSFGFFSFDNVSTGQTYTFRVASRFFRFTPRTVQVNDNLTLADFMGLE